MTAILLLATHNQGKLREFRELLSGLPIELRSLAQDLPDLHVIEDGETFEANAIKKAREGALASGHLVLSDDSGLEVDALGGRPGVRSARYAGEGATDAENNKRLLTELKTVPAELRTARYRVVLALADLHGPLGADVHLEHGVCEGKIGFDARGDHGFGYDPYFIPAGHSRTMAELEPEAKHALSHRGQAAGKMRSFLAEYLPRRARR
jgi:XTP/dITP diphosphohydrolase